MPLHAHSVAAQVTQGKETKKRAAIAEFFFVPSFLQVSCGQTVGSGGNAIECFQWLSSYFLGEFFSMKLTDSDCDSFDSDFESLSECSV